MTVTIHNSSIPPPVEQVIEAMAGRACYSMLDLLVGYDHRTLDIASRDLTTIQSPISTLRLTCLPQAGLTLWQSSTKTSHSLLNLSVTADTFSPVTRVHVTKFPYLSTGALR